MKRKRQEEIIRMIAEKRMVKAGELVERFGVSMETIRRDLESLEEKGVLTRTHGGAMAKTRHGLEPEYTFRETENYEQKIAIGREAAKLVEDGDTLIIDQGTTTLEFVRFLQAHKNLTVLTNAIPIAAELVKNPNIKVILIGGNLRAGELAASGYLAEEIVDQFYVDKVFQGVDGMTLDFGIGGYQIEESNLRRHFVKRSQKVIALADHSKIGVKALNTICSLDELDILITDKDADKKVIAELRRKGVKVIVADS